MSGMYTISKQFSFSASHQLAHLPPHHPCARLHGHNYVVEVVLAARELDTRGFVVDYRDLAPLKELIDHRFDHQHRNDVLPCPTTAENLARWLFEWCYNQWPEVVAVRVSETAKTWAEYRAGTSHGSVSSQ